jgi:hypothetical protein
MSFNGEERAHFQDFQLTATYLSSHPRLREIVEELEDSSEAYDYARRDIKGYFRDKGLQLPDEWKVTVSHDSPITITGCINSWCISYTFSSVTVSTPQGSVSTP